MGDDSAGDEKLGWFDVTVVDAWGAPVGGVDLELSYQGTKKKLRTSPKGNVRVDGVDSSFGSVRFVDVSATRDVVRPRWVKKQPESTPAVENPQVVGLAPDMSDVSITSETPLTIVIVKPLPRVRLIGMHFDTNKSFMRPTAVKGIRAVVAEVEKSPTGNLLVVGHTDSVGGDAENLGLSVDRAEAVKAYLKNDVHAWEIWFDKPEKDKTRWGERERTQMISALPCEQSVAGFQRFSNETRGTSLAVDGKFGPATRKALIEAYMALGGTTLPEHIGIEVHGCGEFFPAEDVGDGIEDEENRRVEMSCFDDKIDPPVPGKKAKKGEPEYPAWSKQVTKTIDVLADGVDLSIPLYDRLARLLPHAPFRVEVDGDVVTGEADEQGIARFVRPKPPVQCRVRWSRRHHPTDAPGAPSPSSARFEFALDYRVDADVGSAEEQAQKRLRNLGYRAGSLKADVEEFQLDHGLRPTGVVAHIEDQLRQEHDEAKVAPRKDDTPAPTDPSPHGPADDPSVGPLPIAPDAAAPDCPFSLHESPDDDRF